MKILIEISERQFADIQRIASVQLKNRLPTVEQIVASGTPFKRIVNSQPTIEPKKGRWRRKVEPYAWRWETWVCSECGEETISTIMGKPRYQWCPMCGADMREGGEEC